MLERTEKDQTLWFSMWFLAAVATYGVAFFPMFYRLIENRNRHFGREIEWEKKISAYLISQGKKPPATTKEIREMNSKVWTISIVLVIPVFVITYILSKDLVAHEAHQDKFLAAALPQRLFMPQTIPIQKYVLITIFTLGIGIVYWLYKVINLYNAHFRAQWGVEKEIDALMEDKKNV
jgi:hypothetical protein